MTDQYPELDRFLAENRGMTARDFKAKASSEYAPWDPHYVERNELPWHQLDRMEVRQAATSAPARLLSRSQRMAAARDPGLIWDEASRSYRLRAEATPAPQEGPGGQKLFDGAASRPVAAAKTNANAGFRLGEASGAEAR